jgi:hypothetical protein
MQTPIYSPEDEQALMARLWSPTLKNDPLAWIMYMFPWGKKGTPLEHFTGPRKWQRDVLNALRDHIAGNLTAAQYAAYRDATCSGRGVGKTALEAMIAIWFLSTRIGSSTIVSANSEAQLKGVFWSELSKWLAMAVHSHWFEPSATKIVPAKWLAEIVEDELRIGCKAWYIEGRLWSEENPDSYAGAHNHLGMMLIFDEASGIPDSIWAVAAGFFTEPVENRFWFAFSNGRRPNGYFFDCFHEKARFWRTRNVDGRDVEGTDKQTYQQIIDEYGADSVQAHVEVYGRFPPTGEEQFIPPSVVEAAMDRPPSMDPNAPVVIGVDPAAGRGRDYTAYVVRRGFDLVKISRNRNENTMETVGHIIDLIEEYKPDMVVIDEGGIGIPIIERLKEQRYKVKPINFGWPAKNSRMWQNKKAEVWGIMKEWLNHASIPKDRVLRSDLITPNRTFNSKGQIGVERKKDLKARNVPSPDYADAVAISLAYPIAGDATSKLKVDRRERTAHNTTPPSQTTWLGH